MTEPISGSRHFIFGSCELDLARGTLSRDGVPVALRRKSFATLQVLVERRGELVTKDELLRAIWGRRVVTDGAIAKCLADVRAAIGDDAHGIIRTVHGRGYRLEVEVRERPACTRGSAAVAAIELAAVDAAAPSPASSRPQSRRPALAAAALAGVLAVSVLATLTARTAVPPNGSVAGVLPASQTAGPTCATPGVAGCHLYLRGRYFYNRRDAGDLDRAERDYGMALRANPAIAEAWAGLAGVYTARAVVADPATRNLYHARRLAAIQSSLAINPSLAEAHARMAQHLLCAGRKQEARAALERSLALDPADPMALALAAGEAISAGRADEALALQARAAAAAPSALTVGNLAGYLMVAGRLAEARVALEAELELRGGDAVRDVDALATLLVLERRYAEVLPALEAAPAGVAQAKLRAIALHALGRAAEADAVVAGLGGMADPWAAIGVGEVYAQRQDYARASDWIAEASRRWSAFGAPAATFRSVAINTSPFLAPVRPQILASSPAGAAGPG